MTMQTTPMSRLVTAKQLADYFAVTPRTIARWRQERLIPFVVTPGGTYRYELHKVEAVLLALQSN